LASIQKGNGVLTLINVFTIEPGKQAELVNVLVRATNEVMKRMPGFISASIHRSFDGTKVVNYAQWADQGAFRAMQQNPKATEFSASRLPGSLSAGFGSRRCCRRRTVGAATGKPARLTDG